MNGTCMRVKYVENMHKSENEEKNDYHKKISSCKFNHAYMFHSYMTVYCRYFIKMKFRSPRIDRSNSL